MKEKIKNILKKKRSLKRPVDFLIFFLLLTLTFGIIYASPALFTQAGGWKISSTSETIINLSNYTNSCKRIGKASFSSRNFFVPTATETEWNSFLNNAPPEAIISNCTSCTDTSWTPLTSAVCSPNNFTQTSNCGNTRIRTGTKDCSGGGGGGSCSDTSWSPDPSGTCDTETLIQVSNCGNTRTVQGTKNCPSYTYTWVTGYPNNMGSYIGCFNGIGRSNQCGVRTYNQVCQRSDGVYVADSYCGGSPPAFHSFSGCNIPSGEKFCEVRICVPTNSLCP